MNEKYDLKICIMKKTALLFLCVFTSLLAAAQNKGYEKSVEITGGIGVDDMQKFTAGVSMVNGYRFNKYLYVGAGVGYEYLKGLYISSYINGNSRKSYDIRSLLKVYGRVKANLSDRKISPFLSIDLGASISLSSNSIKMANGFMLEPSVGADFRTSDNQSVYVMIGYNIQSYQYDYFAIWSEDGIQNEPAGKFALHVGLRF